MGSMKHTVGYIVPWAFMKRNSNFSGGNIIGIHATGYGYVCIVFKGQY